MGRMDLELCYPVVKVVYRCKFKGILCFIVKRRATAFTAFYKRISTGSQNCKIHIKSKCTLQDELKPFRIQNILDISIIFSNCVRGSHPGMQLCRNNYVIVVVTV